MIHWSRVFQLYSEVGEDEFRELIEMYLSEIEMTAAQLGEDTTVPLINDLHFIKGCAVNIGFSSLALLIDATEKQLSFSRSQPDLSAIHQHYLTVWQVFDREIESRLAAFVSGTPLLSPSLASEMPTTETC